MSEIENKTVVNLETELINVEEKLSLVQKKLSELNFGRKFGKDFNDPVRYKMEVKAIIIDLHSIFEKME